MFQNRYIKLFIILLCIIAISIGGILLYKEQNKKNISGNTENSRMIEYNGKKYEPKNNIETILLMGLDKYDQPKDENAYLNDQQSDLMMLMVLDYDKKTCSLIHINRDTMTEIKRLGVTGDVADTFEGQICLAHTYGSGDADSNYNAIDAVEGLFNNMIKIDHYISMTMEGVGILNDAVGGVNVNITEDMTSINPSMVNGSNVTLTGDEALAYVRARSDVGDGSNLSRMERQKQYMYGFIEKLKESIENDSDFLSNSMMKINEYMKSDISINGFDELADKLENLKVQPIEDIEGTAEMGEEFIEYYVDENKLKEKTLKYFYEEVKK